MELSLEEIYKLVLRSLKNNTHEWEADSFDESLKPYWIYNKDLGMYVWTSNEIYGLSIGTIKDVYGSTYKDEKLPRLSWWKRFKLYRHSKKIVNRRKNKKTFDIPVSKKYIRNSKINSIVEK